MLLVTHDRYFLDKVATSILAFEGDGRVVRYAGNFESYRLQRAGRNSASPEQSRGAPRTAAGQPERKGSKPGKLSFKDQRELDGIEAAVASAEERVRVAETALADPATYTALGKGSATRVPS